MPQTPTIVDGPSTNGDRPADSVLLRVEDLRTYFELDGRTIKAVDQVGFEIARGRCHCLVGESGSG
ncbi:MAG TPA: ABC transporter ATP-binding protein, partial [Microlunatus sp.]|nr:ABC transporter ATP-binding protein [Microlunatus sp.]